MKHIFWRLFIAVIGFSLVVGCSEEKNARVEVRLTDAPGDYEEVNIDIQGVEINTQEDDNGWKSLETKKGVYNILKLTNGLDTLLGSIELPPGKLSQIRLKLGTQNSIKMNGQTINLSTPSGQQSGLKLLVNETLVEGVTYKLLLDFDAARSIVRAGNSGKYNLKPVIRVVAEAESGAIKGTVSPLDASPAVYAISGTDTVATGFADQLTGKFLLKGIAPGTYSVSLAPSSGYSTQNKEGVSVSIGAVTDLGIITFN
jgi:hypothetical protein